MERQGSRWLDDVDAAARADLGGARAERDAGRQLHRADRIRPRSAERIHRRTDVDGRPAIRISGEVFGELRTKASFKNYHLQLQFKWGEKQWPPRDKPGTPRDSGLLYHVHAAPGVDGRTWARSVELQIQEHDVGDLYAVGSAIAVRAKARAGYAADLYDYDPTGEWTFFSQSQGSPGRCIKQPDNEKPTGEWNTVELIALRRRFHSHREWQGGDAAPRSAAHRRDLPTPVTSGPIILQSEGAEVFYRDIQIRPITAIPAEFAAEAVDTRDGIRDLRNRDSRCTRHATPSCASRFATWQNGSSGVVLTM